MTVLGTAKSGLECISDLPSLVRPSQPEFTRPMGPRLTTCFCLLHHHCRLCLGFFTICTFFFHTEYYSFVPPMSSSYFCWPCWYIKCLQIEDIPTALIFSSWGLSINHLCKPKLFLNRPKLFFFSKCVNQKYTWYAIGLIVTWNYVP